MATTTLERTFYPDYLDMDFNTVLNKFKTVLLNTSEFADINYEGSNISTYVQMLAYLAELNTYYLNRIAKNLYPDTVELYENAHRIAQLVGYAPKGYISSSGEMKITLVQDVDNKVIFEIGDTLYLKQWSIFSTQTSIGFVTTKDVRYIVSKSDMINPTTNQYDANYVSFTVPVKQGIKSSTYNFNGDDITDYKIYLPTYNFDHDNDITDDYQSIVLTINGIEWQRVSNFFDPIVLSNEETNVYVFGYDKFQQYYVEFSPFRNYPKSSTDKITIDLVISNGIDGNVGQNTIVNATDITLYNMSKTDATYPQNPLEITVSNIYKVTNPSATSGGIDPESLDDIKLNSKSYIYSQARSVTKYDYQYWLTQRSDIVAARSWSEQDINPGGDTTYYNKVYFSVIPSTFNNSTITLSSVSIPSTIMNTTETISYPSSYTADWITDIIKYLKTRKMLCTCECFSVPTLVYFVFDIGIKPKRIYTYDSILAAIKNKLTYYFQPTNRDFFEDISFTDIFNFIMDPTIISSSDSFSAVQGIDSLIFRNIDVIYASPSDQITLCDSETAIGSDVTWTVQNTIYAHNTTSYPQYDKVLTNYYPTFSQASVENTMVGIQLGPNQFPVLALNLCSFANENI